MTFFQLLLLLQKVLVFIQLLQVQLQRVLCFALVCGRCHLGSNAGHHCWVLEHGRIGQEICVQLLRLVGDHKVLDPV